MYLFFDTETTGLSRNKDHVVQVAWILADSTGTVISEHCHVIQPDGYDIPWGAAKIHGITTAIAKEIGKPLDDVLEDLADDSEKATILVAHNLYYDIGILQHAYQLAGIDFPFHSKTQVCTMRLSTTWCRLPKLNGSPGFKYPKLEELHYRLFGESFDGAHDALSDTRACMRCYFQLVDKGVITPPTEAALKLPEKSDHQAVSQSRKEVYTIEVAEPQSANTHGPVVHSQYGVMCYPAWVEQYQLDVLERNGYRIPEHSISTEVFTVFRPDKSWTVVSDPVTWAGVLSENKGESDSRLRLIAELRREIKDRESVIQELTEEIDGYEQRALDAEEKAEECESTCDDLNEKIEDLSAHIVTLQERYERATKPRPFADLIRSTVGSDNLVADAPLIYSYMIGLLNSGSPMLNPNGVLRLVCNIFGERIPNGTVFEKVGNDYEEKVVGEDYSLAWYEFWLRRVWLQCPEKNSNAVLSMLKSLTQREIIVLALRFGLAEVHVSEWYGATLTSVALAYGVLREQVHQIEAKSLRICRNPSRSEGIRELVPCYTDEFVGLCDIYGDEMFLGYAEHQLPEKIASALNESGFPRMESTGDLISIEEENWETLPKALKRSLSSILEKRGIDPKSRPVLRVPRLN